MTILIIIKEEIIVTLGRVLTVAAVLLVVIKKKNVIFRGILSGQLSIKSYQLTMDSSTLSIDRL